LEEQSSIIENDIKQLTYYLHEQNPRLNEILHEFGDCLAANKSLYHVVDGKIKINLENPNNKKVVELKKEYSKLIIIEFKKWKESINKE
jgi:hypothetical protein